MRRRLLGHPVARRLAAKLPLLLAFTTGQLGFQLVQVLGALVVIWALPPAQYGHYVFFVGLQMSAASIIDLASSSAIISLAGRGAAGDLERFMRAGLRLRVRMAAFVLPVATIIVGLQMSSAGYGPDAWSLALLFAVALGFHSLQSFWATALIFRQDMAGNYLPQIIVGLLRAGVLLACVRLGARDLPSLILITVAGQMASAVWTWRRARQHTSLAEDPDGAAWRSLTRFVTPLAPSTLYTSVQDNVLTFAGNALGHAAVVGQVAALARIGQIFQFLQAVNGLLLFPWIARAPAGTERVRLAALFAFFFIVSGGMLAVATFWPEPFLFILGPNYRHLQAELLISLVASSLQFLGHLLWTFNAARGFVFRWSGAAQVILVLSAQLTALAVLDLSDPREALLMPLAVAAAFALLQASITALGMVRASRVGAAGDPDVALGGARRT